ncbi:MAG TPA: polysaccharide biosynthesis C-terminal domain-containing protein [Candidatus Krumholzibacteria bacterium]|nr:polysaccharide biosynthesis C-terminal domain-containing protein [Candidatus Krumholzibacteria bacterium]HPD72025.1 polysaccharide biosynthesis C-terminal domain-containing protein [Candidatus Krumholzibacteria bacterium]HRY41042.1 polysaccharide biosynthesis C-terminal domain-containing protein [Candidatus Krumholzibacteria bacterium]
MPSIVKESKLLARHSSVYAVGILLQRATALVLLPLYTTRLTPQDFGIKELVGLSVDVADILLATAISSAIYRFYFRTTDLKQRNLVISTSIIALGAGGILALVGLIPLSAPLAGLVLDDIGLAHFFMLSFAALWFQTVNKVSFAWLRAQQKSVQFVAISLLRFVINVGLNIWFIVGLDLGVLGIILATLVTAVVVFLFMTVPLCARLGLRFDRGMLREMWTFGWPMIFSQAGGFVVHLSDRLFLKAYCSVAAAGIYSLGYRFGTLPSVFLSEPFNQTWMPRRFEVAKEPGSERVFGRIFTYYLVLIAFAGLLVACLTTDILRLMSDPSYWTAASVVPVIVLANIIFTFHYHFNIGLMLADKTKYLGYINVANAALVLLLNWLLIPRYASMGAAIATLIAFVAKSGATFVLGRRFYRIHFEGVRAAKLVAVAAVVYVGVNRLELATPLASLILKGSVIVAAYPLLLVAVGFVNSEERARAGRYLRRRLGRSAA